MRLKKLFKAVLPPLFIMFFLVTASFAGSKFREDYIKALEQNNFTALEYLGKNGLDVIPGEVRELLKEARSAGTFDDRMHLMDVAVSMAGMYKHWKGDDKLLNEVEAYQKEEIKKENARLSELQKWNRFEALPGNLVLRDLLPEMEAKGLSPVLYPHWIHRLLYDCKVCHQGIFTMKRGANAITQAKILEGKQCGVCHNGSVSFSAKENCERCHMAGKPASEAFLNPSKYGSGKIKEAAAKVGSSWDPGKLKDGKFPLDRLGFPDWTAMKDAGVYAPVKSLDKGAKEEVRDNRIFFEPKMAFIKGVVFDHKTHSSRVECGTCHQEIFKDSLGANKVTMTVMAEGGSCGACHNKVAFKFADCNRCHTVAQGQPVDGALRRTPAAAAN